MAAMIERYDVFELTLINGKSYQNPFDFCEIELRGTFKSPSGKTIEFYGFHDGDGNGGQQGNVWKLRFMPDEPGTWRYTASWTDGTPGAQGTFTCIDTEAFEGPLKTAEENPWYFSTARGSAFDARGYMFLYGAEAEAEGRTARFNDDEDQRRHAAAIDRYVIDRGYNLVMMIGCGMKSRPASMTEPRQTVNQGHTWWQWSGERYDLTRYQVLTWTNWDRYMNYYRRRGLYVMPFALIHEWDLDAVWQMGEMKRFQRYMLARCAPYYNLFGYNFTWEFPVFLGDERSAAYYEPLRKWNPFGALLGRHDDNRDVFRDLVDFTMRQRQSRDIVQGNDRTATWHNRIDGVFVNRPIIGSEDIWEIAQGTWNQPRDGDEIRRGAWGSMMAGVMPLYDEWHDAPQRGKGKGDGEPFVRLMFDFFYINPKVDYRNPGFRQLNALAAGQAHRICSGVPGQEYLVYAENGGDIHIDLSGTGAGTFSVLWFNPVAGINKEAEAVDAGQRVTLTSPFKSDTVLLLRRQSRGLRQTKTL